MLPGEYILLVPNIELIFCYSVHSSTTLEGVDIVDESDERADGGGREGSAGSDSRLSTEMSAAESKALFTLEKGGPVNGQTGMID
jgi:hypothetical protein